MDLIMALRADRVEGGARIAARSTRWPPKRQARHRRSHAQGRGRLLLRRRQRAGARAHRRRRERRGLPARRSATTLPAKPGDIKAAVCVLHGSKDPVVPKKDRDALEAEMDGAGANWQMLDFGGRLHSFCEEETDVPGIADTMPAPRSRATRCSTTSSTPRST